MILFKMPKLGLLWGLVYHVSLVGVFASVGHHNGSAADDPHGGVVMGVPNHFCDDGKSYLDMDWESYSSDEYTCQEDVDLDTLRSSYESCEEIAKRPIHVCHPEKIHYNDDLPTSGRHRPLWPKYGEYQYLPPQRWLHSLEHGAIVFLYNPCANKDQISELKALAKGCLRRHIISPSKRIPHPNMFAVLSWKCKMVMTHVDQQKVINFVRTHALHSPEKSVHADGQYSLALTHHAKLVSDLEERELCPEMPTMEEAVNIVSGMSAWRQKLLLGLETAMRHRVASNK